MSTSQPQPDWLSRMVADDEAAILQALTGKPTTQTQVLTDVGDSTESLEPQGE